MASNPNLRKSPEIHRFLALIYLSLTSKLPSPHGTIPSNWCLLLYPFAETYPVKMETCPHPLIPRTNAICGKTDIHVTVLTIEVYETSRYKVFSSYIMQGSFTSLLPATVSIRNQLSFLYIFFQFQHILVEIRHEQPILNNTVLFKFGFGMKLCNFSWHFPCIL